MSSLTHSIKDAAIDAIVETIKAESDPWRKARLLAFVRKERGHQRLLEVAQGLFANEQDHPPERRQCYWAALELLTTLSEDPPAEGPLWIEPVSGVCFLRVKPGPSESGDVELSEFWLARHAVTNGEYRLFLKADAGATEPERLRDPLFNQAGRPIEVSWENAQNGYCKWLRERTKHLVHLPSEAQWEYACRAGSTGSSCDEADLENYAWYAKNSGGKSHPVGLKRPNQWGLQDMLGNAWEWCLDRYQSLRLHDPVLARWYPVGIGRGGAFDTKADICNAETAVSAPSCAYRPLKPRLELTLGFRPAVVKSREAQA